MTGVLYLDDIQPGDRHVTPSATITEAEIVAFAREFDPQPFHLSEEAARGTMLGGLAASGWHTAALSMRLIVTGGMKLAGGSVGMGGELSWPHPTRPGDVLHVESTVLAVEPSARHPDRGTVTVENLTRNAAGEVVQRFVAKIRMQRRPAP